MDCIGRMVMRPRERERTSHYNLYRYCHNDPVNRSDPFGLLTYQFTEHFPAWAKADFLKVIDYLKQHSPHYRARDAKDHRMIAVQAAKGPFITQFGYVGNRRYLFIDPYSSTYLTDGQKTQLIHLRGNQMPPPGIKGRAIVVGHEVVGHGSGELDEHDGGRNVEKNENPIRRDLGERPRERDFGATVIIHHDGIDTRRRP